MTANDILNTNKKTLRSQFKPRGLFTSQIKFFIKSPFTTYNLHAKYTHSLLTEPCANHACEFPLFTVELVKKQTIQILNGYGNLS